MNFIKEFIINFKDFFLAKDDMDLVDTGVFIFISAITLFLVKRYSVPICLMNYNIKNILLIAKKVLSISLLIVGIYSLYKTIKNKTPEIKKK